MSHTAASPTATPNAESAWASISADGSFVLFGSRATNVVAGQSDTNGAVDVFLFERATGAVTLVSDASTSPSTTGNGNSDPGSLSADGAFATFSSFATNLVTGQTDTNGVSDVFLFTRATGAVSLISHVPASVTGTAAGHSCCGAISANGEWVAFRSGATNLVTGQSDSNGFGDAFLWHRPTGQTTLVSHVAGSATTTGNGRVDQDPSVSDDGAFVTFGSTSTNPVSGQVDANGSYDVFLFAGPAEP